MVTSGCRLLALLWLAATVAACSPRPEPLVVAWTAEWGGHAVECGAQAPEGLNLDDLRLFVHDVRLVDASGHETQARFVPDGRWQTERVALIDFAPGCDRERHAEMKLLAPRGDYAFVRFRLGVPFELNHANPALAEGPLGVGAMNWSWQGGYRFLKLDGKAHGLPLRVHVGSTECEGTFAHITDCRHPNRSEVELPLKRAGIALDLSALVPLKPEGAVRCESDDSANCASMFAALGLNLKNGLAAGGQHAFRAR